MERERLGKYELEKCLGQGGMGDVWKAYDTELRRYVAIKFILANLQDDPDSARYFMREARNVASLHHPNIVKIHDFQLTDTRGSSATAYMVMDYIEDGTLADYIRNTSRKRLFPPAADIVYLFTAISLALDYAHERGMIHRDIKPTNIFLDKHTPTGKSMGEPILGDFGLAKSQGAASTFSRAGAGTPLYISPEQVEASEIDGRSDLYSLGIILYEILTGVPPFRDGGPIAVMMQHLHEIPTPPALINPDISPELSAVVLKSIAKDPKERFPTASSMTIALAQALQVPVPSTLNKPRITNDQPDYNPLQPPTPLPGMAPPAFTASSPAASTLTKASYPEFQPISPAHLPSTRSERGGDNQQTRTIESQFAATPHSVSRHSPIGDHSLQPPSSPPSPPSKMQRRRRGLYITCIILLLAGGISAFSLLFLKNTSTAPSVVGHIIFMHSPNAPPNIFDRLQINIENISSPTANKTYYAWLDNPNREGFSPSWKLQVSNRTVRYRTPIDTTYTDLLTRYTRFLITKEDAGATITVPDFNARLYYALISRTSSPSPTFEVKECPPDINNAANPCH